MLPDALKAQLEATLGTAILKTGYVGGGDINQACQLETREARYFLKWNHQSPPGMFSAEAKGLGLLKSAQALRVPDVIAVQEPTADVPAFLILEWVPTERPKNSDLFAERLGHGLAHLHQQQASQHGLEQDNYIGTLPQTNTPNSSWVAFYRDARIGKQQDIAQQRQRLPAARQNLLDKLRTKLPDLIPEVEPSLLHGDLWGGNYLATENDTPVIYDPAVYYGHREVELAFTELFGGFPSRFYDAYYAVYPIDKGYTRRKALYQLYPMMVHMNLFGGSYAHRADQIAQQYV